jgi:two-component system chemotaxis response regulator CheB
VIRVLVADDSRAFRGVLRAILGAVSGLEVVGEAVDGEQAVAQTVRLRPDVITLDLDMPGMGGLAALVEIMARAPTPVVVVSAVAGPEHQETSFRALALGAVEVLRKPSAVEPGRFARDADAIRAAVTGVAGLSLPRRAGPGARTPTPLPGLSAAPLRPQAPAARPRVEVVGVAASTGGPPALGRLLRALPADFPAPILVVQHIAGGFEGGLARWLATQTALQVRVAAQGEPLRPATVYLAPEGRHLVARAGRVGLDDGPAVRGFKPSGTALFSALAREYGAAAAGVILTGMGDDGVEGLLALSARGGATLAQGPRSSVLFGMPREAIERGAAGETLELDEIAPALLRLTARPRA